jgi:hypothetical protein
MTYTQEFDTQIAQVTDIRGKVYGSPYEHFGAVAAIKEQLSCCQDPRIRHILEMIAVKLHRAATSPTHIDNWIDISGYARTACMVLDEARANDGNMA